MPASIIDALDDEALFKPFFRGNTWAMWRCFLKCLFGLPLDDSEMSIFRHHTERQTPPTSVAKEAAVAVGRRGSKTRMLSLVAVYLACFFNYQQFLAPGERGTIALIAADRRQARSAFRFISGLLNNVPLLTPMIESETADSISLNNGVTIEIHTASFRVVRGYSLIAVLADELCFWRNEDSANPDRDIIAAVRPGLSNIPNSMLLMASSVYSKRGVLYDTYKRHFGKDDARTLVWKATTLEANPTIDPAIIEQALEEDPEAASAEYLSIWRSDLGAYITREVIAACTVPGRFELAPVSSRRAVCFLDAAGGSGSDSMTIAIAYRDGEKSVLAAVRERKPPFSPDDVVQEFSALMKSYGVTSAESDKWGGDWVGEAFRKHGIRVEPCAKPKSDIYREVLPELNSGRVELLDLPRLATQFCALERRVSRNSKDSIDHPPSGKDDLCNAAAGALLMATTKRGAFVISPEALALAAEAPRRNRPIFNY